jgi:hypothetical protein
MAGLQHIIWDIKEHIRLSGGPYSTWYVGIADDPFRELADRHGNKKYSWSLYRAVSNNTLARRIVKHFIRLGTAGSPGTRNKNLKVVYAYKRRSHDTRRKA